MTTVEANPRGYETFVMDIATFLDAVHHNDFKIPHRVWLATILAKHLFKLGYKKED